MAMHANKYITRILHNIPNFKSASYPYKRIEVQRDVSVSK